MTVGLSSLQDPVLGDVLKLRGRDFTTVWDQGFLRWAGREWGKGGGAGAGWGMGIVGQGTGRGGEGVGQSYRAMSFAHLLLVVSLPLLAGKPVP